MAPKAVIRRSWLQMLTMRICSKILQMRLLEWSWLKGPTARKTLANRVCPTGAEPVTFGSGDRKLPRENAHKSSGLVLIAESECITGCTNPSDPDLPDLIRVLTAWPNLSAPIRAAMLALIQSAASTAWNAPVASGKARKG